MNKIIKGLDIVITVILVFQAIYYFALYITKTPIDINQYVVLGVAFLVISFHRVVEYKLLN